MVIYLLIPVAISTIGILFCFVMLLRNNTVYESINMIGDDYQPLDRYDEMLWDFTCWTKQQFMKKAT